MAGGIKKWNSHTRNTRKVKVRMLCIRARERCEQQDAKDSLLERIRSRETQDGD